ncbi:MAG TPA: hypothetical protein DCY54_01515 [Parachlamydiales bacterium]|nr:MAG: hypothetical protein A2Z85_04905 [Chlamydiae bacterium GWA2_50_15]OGN57440.1 MAG: hypothetical protein A3D18_01200 [Chlamydiae bacterium RIFCSPHIGHO2_02_FULL_49_29]OGN67455.1 MAG: hypothetical protein A3I15_01930 [Chlamydiae bacterium RIFCSPLOWO2_02_FULL_49_12]OGN72311.1 MAG: hypothetical protein A3G30_04325 [Chlamydiae bacterium RIFCSPLOWO2_12_FULL_49_12]HAZ15313.1 hypothetical protein [Parachlamydiales bacterium]
MGSAKQVSGPEGPIQPTGVREKRLPSDAEAFQKALDKVGEADPEQKKKQRQKEEEAEDARAAIKDADKLAKPKDTIAPFMLGQTLTAKPSLTTGTPFAAATPSAATPPLVEGADAELLFWEEEEFQEPPLAKEREAAPPREEAVAGKEKLPASPEKKPEAEKEEKVPGFKLEEAALEKVKEKREAAPPPPPEEAVMIAPMLQPGIAPPPPTEILSYAQLSPQVLELFERMSGVMMVMAQSGVTETTLSLTAPQFAESIFYGSEIIIREYSTAPLQFNVEVRGNPEAVALFQANIPYIESSLRSGNYNFGIYRMETSLLRIEEKPVSEKKEGKRDREKDEREGR